MRITNKVLTNGYLTDLNRNLQNMQKIQEQLSTGKKISKPSDDPLKVGRSMELNTSLKANERYQENIDEAIGWLETTDSALGQFGDVLQRVNELTISAGNSTYSSTEKEAVKTEMEQLKAQLVEIGNTSYDGKYIFNGDETTEIPFKDDGTISFPGANGLKKEFSQGVVLDIGITSTSLSIDSKNPPASGNVFSTIDEIIKKLDSNESPTDLLNDLSNHIDNALKLRAKAGTRTNRLETMKDKNTDENYNITELLSKTEDIDVAEKTMEYSTLESVYTSSLQVGGKILQKSLLDFLE